MNAALAFDRNSVRTIDADGRLHVAMSNISKATVNPYYGREIPNARALGLDASKIYYMLRCPRELERAAPTFNNLPILSEHVPVTADAHAPEYVIGSTGTDAQFSEGYLRNSSVIWAGSEIAQIASDQKREWSCGYRYRADMTPGVFYGLRYDGVMRDIVGNHVALVHQGRAGRDVMVADSLSGVGMKLNSRHALKLSGALSAFVAPMLAQGKTVEFAGALDGVTAKNIGEKRDGIAAKVIEIVAPVLAQDASIDAKAIVDVIAALPAIADGDEIAEDAAPEGDDVLSKAMGFLEGKLSPADAAGLAAIVGDAAPGAKPDDNGGDDTVDKPTMDAAIRIAEDKARKDALAEMSAIRQAERDVAPHVGEVKQALDSAAAVYRLALDAAKVDLNGVPESAYAALVRLLPLPDTGKPAPRIAADAAITGDFYKRFPNAIRLVRG